VSEIICGDTLTVLRSHFADESVQCCVTSPPYWGLRDYGVAGQMGLEATPELYTARMVEVFREVRRVLRADGTLWLNLGDSYWGSGKGLNQDGTHSSENKPTDKQYTNGGSLKTKVSKYPDDCGIKPKDLVGIPWRVAFAIQADGWYLRSDIIWSKPNPMPESVTDRPTKAHEYLFLLSKSERYWYDADAIKEPAIYAEEARYDPGTNGLGGGDRKTGKSTRRFGSTLSGGEYGRHFLGDQLPQNERRKALPEGQERMGASCDKQRGHSRRHNGFNDRWDQMTKEEQCSNLRNKRSVWTVPTQPYAGAHFATFPTKLVEPCILAGCPVGGLVLDPFAGSGTVLAVAKQLGRQGVGIELNPAYIALAVERTKQQGLAL